MNIYVLGTGGSSLTWVGTVTCVCVCVAAQCLGTGRRVKTVNRDTVEDVPLGNPAERWMILYSV